MKRVTDFHRYKSERQPISMVTCYDTWSAKLIEKTGIDAVLVGDSVAMVVHGYDSTIHATTEMMATHTAAVRRGLGDNFIIADIPFLQHRKGVECALECVDALMKAGASAVKLEGAQGHIDTVRHIVESGVPVMGHLGLMPQSVHQVGGYRVQGKAAAEADQLVRDALALEGAGCFAIVLECIPEELAAQVTAELSIPTIGIGSGKCCSGQVLVLQDLLGMNLGFKPKFLKTYGDGATFIQEALQCYDHEVKQQLFPSKEQSFT